MNTNFTDCFPIGATFPPSWTGSGGTPTLGNGTLSCRWMQHGDIVIAHYYFNFGSTTVVAGTGSWSFTFPVAQNTSQQFWNGSARLYNATTGGFTVSAVEPNTATTFDVLPGGASPMGEGVPFAWVTNSKWYATIIYEAA